MSTAALKSEKTAKIGEESEEDIPDRKLFDPEMIHHVVTLWILTPVISAVLSYGVFALLNFI